jgi:hypothetical protein
MVPQLQDLSYAERLLNLSLTSLEDRRTRGDPILLNQIEEKWV